MVPDPSNPKPMDASQHPKPKPVDSSQTLKPSITPKPLLNPDSKNVLSFLDAPGKKLPESILSSGVPTNNPPAPPGNYEALQFLDVSENQSATAYPQTKRLERQKIAGGTIDQYKLVRVFKENSWSITYVASIENSNETFFLRLLKSSVLQIPGAVEEIENALKSIQSWKREDFLIFSPLIRSSAGVYFLAPFQELFLLQDHPEKKLNTQQALKVLSKLIDGLIFLREKTLLHRQLNPSTILMDKQNRVIFDELELSYALERRVQENQIHRNPDFLELNNEYHSLEFMNGQWVDPRSDIYSLGLILFELLTGEYPFKASSPEQQKLRQMTNTLGDLKKLNPLCPEDIQNLVLKCCSGEPIRRYQSLEEIRETIEKIRQEWATPAKSSNIRQINQSRPISNSAQTDQLRRIALWISLAIPLILLVYFVLNSQKSIREDSDQLWTSDHIARCAGIVLTLEENETSTRVVLTDFENIQRILYLSNEILQEQNIQLTSGVALVCEGRVVADETGTFCLNVDQNTIANPPPNRYYQEKIEEPEEGESPPPSIKKSWEEIFVPNWDAPIRVEGPILRLLYEESQCFIQLGEGEQAVKFFVPLKTLEKLNFSPRLGQMLGVEFYQNTIPLKIQSEKHLFRLESWIPGK